MNPYYSDEFLKLYNTSSRRLPLKDGSVHCVVTSPPYWNLRKYAGDRGDVWGGRPCLHEWDSLWQHPACPDRSTGKGSVFVAGRNQPSKVARGEAFDYGETCVRCGAWRGKYGLEPTVAMYIAHSLKFLLDIRRVLRDDGIVFWTLGDTYWGSGRAAGDLKSTNMGNRMGTVRLGWTAMIDRIIIPLSCMVEVRKVYEKTHFLDNSYYGDFNSSICDLGMAEYE